jgi:hypothetical protein
MASTSSHLSYPASEAPEGSTSTLRAPSPPLPELLKNRLYVGNLHPTVDEFVPRCILNRVEPLNHPRYTLIQVFSKFGKLARLDYLFHKTGALRGKPRGYAFVEYTGEGVSAHSTHLLLPSRNINKMLNPGLSCTAFGLHLCAGRSFPSTLRSALLFSDPGSAAAALLPPARCTDCTSETMAALDPLTLWSSRFCRTRPSRWKRQAGRSFVGDTSLSRTRTRRPSTRTTPRRVARCHNTISTTTNSRTLDDRRRSVY